MANTRANSRRRKPGRGKLWLFALVLVVAGAAWWFRAPIAGYSGVSTAYAARVACSCRFIGGRDLADCGKDMLAGMELVTLSQDLEAKSVTARFPLISSTTATYREGYGCVLEEWER